ncbi:unnamed protein product [Paramecium primaurelia]|uniref:Uncharacterized protein n=1 Tax=Paramecium primaurelia TaxID=5886 RepID=A0A8S1MWG0_PARPR|nr:unnamed protein product [Paramecium primaurelia]
MNTESQAIDLNRRILKSSLTRQFTRSPTRSRKRIISLPPLEAAQNQYQKLKQRNISYHKESPREVFIFIISVVRFNLFDHQRIKWFMFEYLSIYQSQRREKIFFKQQIF